jgi:hypothetical protein
VGVQQGLVLAVEHVLLRVLRALLDPLPLDVHHDQLLVRVHAADPGRGERHLLSGQPLAGVDHEVAELEALVDEEVRDLPDLTIRGKNRVAENLFRAHKHGDSLLREITSAKCEARAMPAPSP